MRRSCDRCETPLPGPKRHGFVTPDGKGIWCRFCMNPPKKKETGRNKFW